MKGNEMAITFDQYPARPNVSFDDRCLGYMIQTFDSEILYAMQGGKFFQTNVLKRPNNDFDKQGRKWREVATIPPLAQFIGHYPHITA